MAPKKPTSTQSTTLQTMGMDVIKRYPPPDGSCPRPTCSRAAMLIAVPRGAKAGHRLVLDTSTGARWVVPLPPGATHGTTLTIARPQTAAPDEHIVQVVLATELPLPPPGAVGTVEASPRAAASSAGWIAAEGSPQPSRGPSLLARRPAGLVLGSGSGACSGSRCSEQPSI